MGRHPWQWHEGDMNNDCNVKSDGPLEHHSPRQTEPSLDTLFPAISHVFTPLCHAPIPAAHALLRLFLPWIFASFGHSYWQLWVPPGDWKLPSIIILVSRGCTWAPGTLGRTWLWSVVAELSQEIQPLGQPLAKAAGSLGAPPSSSSSSSSLPAEHTASHCPADAAAIPGLCAPSSSGCPAGPGDELSVSQPPQVVFSLSTLERGSLALE